MRPGVIRYKIWYDLWENKARTLRVVAIIAIGAFAVGTILGGKEFILIVYWFGIITVLAIIASWSPAHKAAQTSVRDSLAYS